MAQASRRSVTASVAAAANLQLVRRDAVLSGMKLREDYISRARLAPFTGVNVIGPNPRDFTKELMTMRTQQSTHTDDLTYHFKIPKLPASKAAAQKRPVHQRLGPPVSGRNQQQPFRSGEQRNTASTAAPGPGAGRGRHRGRRSGKKHTDQSSGSTYSRK